MKQFKLHHYEKLSANNNKIWTKPKNFILLSPHLNLDDPSDKFSIPLRVPQEFENVSTFLDFLLWFLMWIIPKYADVLWTSGTFMSQKIDAGKNLRLSLSFVSLTFVKLNSYNFDFKQSLKRARSYSRLPSSSFLHLAPKRSTNFAQHHSKISKCW